MDRLVLYNDGISYTDCVTNYADALRQQSLDAMLVSEPVVAERRIDSDLIDSDWARERIARPIHTVRV